MSLNKESNGLEYEDGKITVCVRSRPFNEREKKMNSSVCLRFVDQKSVMISSLGFHENGETPPPVIDLQDKLGERTHAFSYDYAFDSGTPQDVLYNAIGRPVLASSFRGFNTCIFAYGQTGSGKSHSMMGPHSERDIMGHAEAGIIPRLCEELYAEIEIQKQRNEKEIAKARQEGCEEHSLPPVLDIHVYASYLEIYNEKVRCLLKKGVENLNVRQHPALGVYVEGLTELAVNNAERFAKIMSVGTENRHSAATKMNESSSRSHAIFAITLVQKRKGLTKEGTEQITELRAKINLVDLAGSERAKSTGAEGGTLREGAMINKSLTILGLVISALAEACKSSRAAPHIPYRDSKLTHILRESLGGNSKTYMLSTLSPATVNHEETLSTLRYADRAKSIVTRAFVNESASDKKIRELENEVSRLREKLRAFQEGNQNSPSKRPSTSKQFSDIPEPLKSKREAAIRSMAQGSLSLEDDEELNNSPKSDDLSDAEKTCRQLLTDQGGGDEVELEAQLSRVESIMKKLTCTDAEKEQEALDVLKMFKEQATVRVNRKDPYLLNVDAVGDWVMEHFVEKETFLGTSEGEASTQRSGGNKNRPLLSNATKSRYIVIPGDLCPGVGPQHCCFIRQPGGSVLIRPLKGFDTYVNNSSKPISTDTLLQNGDFISVGTDFITFKFTDPTVPPSTAKVNRPRPQSVDPNSPNLGRHRVPARTTFPSNDELHEKKSADFADSLSGSLTDYSDNGGDGAPPKLPSPVKPTTAIIPPLVPQLKLGGLGKKDTLLGGVRVPAPFQTSRTTQKTTKWSNYKGKSEKAQSDVFDDPAAGSSILQKAVDPDLSGKKVPQAIPATARVNSSRLTGMYTNNDNAPDRHEAVARHSFVFIGHASAGKSALRANLQRPDKWYSFVIKEVPVVYPTFGLDVAYLNTTEEHQNLKLNLIELGGNSSFYFLRDHIPTTRATYVLVFSLEITPSLDTFSTLLEFILCQTVSRDTSIVLVATHLDSFRGPNEQLFHLFDDLEQQITSSFEALQPNASLRPTIVGRFAVDNDNRSVYSPGFRKISKFPELLNWFRDHALQRCRSDTDFPNCQIPGRVLELSKCAIAMRLSGKWCMSTSEYKTLAKAIYPPYGSNLKELHVHTQLLDSWGLLQHRYRHAMMRKHVIIDVPLTRFLIAILSCCSPRTSYYGKHEMVALREGTLQILSSIKSSFGRCLPFNVNEVSETDPCNLLPRGVMTLRSAHALFSNTLRNNCLTALKLTDVLLLLHNYSYLMEGSKLLYSSFHSYGEKEVKERDSSNASTSISRLSMDALSKSCMNNSKSSDSNPHSESFYLIPSYFRGHIPASLSALLPRLLSGPFYRFTFNLVPRGFFSKIVCRISEYAEKIYLGPVSPNTPEARNNSTSFTSRITKSGNAANSNPALAPVIIEGQGLWENAAWVIGSNTGRAFTRLVQHTLFVVFHQISNDDDFYNGLCEIVRSVVNESPGATCQESLLCSNDYPLESNTTDSENFSESTYYRAVDENINNLEKIRQKENIALLTARGRRSGNPEPEDTEINNSEAIIPFVRKNLPLMSEAMLLRYLESSKPRSSVITAVKRSWKELESLRNTTDTINEDDAEKQASAMDKLIDCLAYL